MSAIPRRFESRPGCAGFDALAAKGILSLSRIDPFRRTFNRD